MSETKSPRSARWDQALERFREDLEERADYESVLEEGSLEGLLQYAQSAENDIRNREHGDVSKRLKPILQFVDDFAAVLAMCFGADPRLTAMVWGSIRLMLSLSSGAKDTLHEVLDMLDELSLTLPRFLNYEDTLPVDAAFEKALVDVYAEMICFYARTIHFLRDNPHTLTRRNAWEKCKGDFQRTIKRIKRLSQNVESEAELARMRRDQRFSEVLEAVNEIRESKANPVKAIPFWIVPRQLNKHFIGRDEEIGAIQTAFTSRPKTGNVDIFALYGMGGIGKTQIALQYAQAHYKKHGDTFWVAAENLITLNQSCTEVARQLGLLGNSSKEDMQDSSQAISKVKQWLIESDRNWLLVLDNVESLDLIRCLMPISGRGSILLTTRNFNIAREIASASMQVQAFRPEVGAQALLRITENSAGNENNVRLATEISEALGGLPLAVSQIGSFAAQRQLPLSDILATYKKYAAKIDARKSSLGDYEHTLSTVWQMSLERLEGAAKTLQELLAFFEPDFVSENLLLNAVPLSADPSLEILGDEFEFGDAEHMLLELALIDKAREEKAVSVHRLVQAVVIRRLSEAERSRYFAAVARMLCWGFPDHWSQDQGHQIATWVRCEMCLPHVNHLIYVLETYKIKLTDVTSYAELLLRCGWYLYEREMYTTAERFVSSALKYFDDQKMPAYASAIDLAGLIALDLAKPTVALTNFNTALDMRRQYLDHDDMFIAFSLNNIALAQTELGNLEKAHEMHTQAISIRLKHNGERIGNSYSNLAALFLRMDKPDEAERTLAMCPSLKDFTDETFLSTGNPRFSGDMVLLSRIRLAQGRDDEALRLASKALVFRKSLLGNGLKTCDSLYDVAHLLILKGNLASAAELLRDLVEIAEASVDGSGQLARGLWRLGNLQESTGRLEEAEDLKRRARAIRSKLRPDLDGATDEDEAFSKLCLFMLW